MPAGSGTGENALVPGVLAAWWIDDASHGAVVELAVATVVVLGGFVALASLTRDLGVAQWRFLLGWLRLAPLRRS